MGAYRYKYLFCHIGKEKQSDRYFAIYSKDEFVGVGLCAAIVAILYKAPDCCTHIAHGAVVEVFSVVLVDEGVAFVLFDGLENLV